MLEYPKRVYVGGRGYTVNSPEEEQAFLSPSIKKESTKTGFVFYDLVEVPVVEEPRPTEDKIPEVDTLESLVAKGYSKTAAKKILKKAQE